MHRLLVILTFLSAIMTGYAQAAMVSTHNTIGTEAQSFSQQELQSALQSKELQEQLEDLGVDPDELGDRIASLTPAEIVQLNAELEEQPAGGIVGILLTVFIVFVITDMLCATNIFSFVKCINK